MKKGNFTYEADFTESTFKPDDYIIKNVVLLGPKSKNNREYTADCMRNALPLFENIQAFIDHPTIEEKKTGRRSTRNLAGKYTNVRYEDGKVKADGKFLPNENGKLYMDVAEHMPDVAGNSQSAHGQWRMKDGKQIVEQIKKVYSVDLVASPATTRGLFESENKNTGDHDMDWSEVTKALLLAHKPEIHEAIFDEGKDEGKKSRDTEINKLQEDNKDLKAKVDEYEVKESTAEKATKISKLVEDAKLPKEAVTDTFKESLSHAKDEEQIKALIEDRKKLVEAAEKGGVKNMGGDKTNKGKDLDLKEAKASVFG